MLHHPEARSHKFPPEVDAPCCSVCGGKIPKNALTEKNIAWALEHGVRCEECEEVKRAFMVRLKKQNKEKAEGR